MDAEKRAIGFAKIAASDAMLKKAGFIDLATGGATGCLSAS